MEPARWQQVKEIFSTALEMDPARREAFLDQRCAGDVELKQTIVELLAASSQPSGDALETPAQPSVLETLVPLIGQRIGAYKLTRELGRGGMGAVYLGERADGQFRQSVAVKLVKRGMDTDFILSRFRQERQILASLDHPYIARLLDGGSTDDGLPYFVMEHVEGVPLYAFAAQRQLDIRARLELFAKVCEAVASAHAQHIVHRDLKPSNILVTAKGAPKLLDFGIAKWLNPEPGDEAPTPTATQMRILTPDYASPEQVQGLAVTPASDVYSGGVLLYEFVTGRRPYRFASRTMHDTIQVICGVDPVKPSEAVLLQESVAPASDAGTPRSASSQDLSRELSGDLDNILLRALRKEPRERYATMEDLHADIQRYLAGHPVEAKSFAAKPAAALRQEPRAIDDKALAVLPLKVIGRLDDTDSGSYLGVGLADTLITRLSQLRSFGIRPTSSILKFSVDTDAFKAGRELGVRYVLDGNLRRAGRMLRVSMQLLDVLHETTIWAQQFHSEADDVLKLEDDISAQVAQSLAPQLSGTQIQQLARRGTNNEAAFQAYARGRYHWAQFTPPGLLQAKAFFEQAIQLDPHYPLAHVGMADSYHFAGIFGLLPTKEALLKARQHAERALSLDNELGEAHSAFGFSVTYVEWDFAKAEQHYKRAIELAPNFPQGYEWYGAQNIGVGLFDMGLAITERAEEIDPLSLRTKAQIAWQRYQAGRLTEALAKADETIELDPAQGVGHFARGNALEQLGRVDEAIAALETARKLMPGAGFVVCSLCFTLQKAGRSEEARRVADELMQAAQSGYVKPWFLALTYAALGELDKAFDYFEQAFEEHDPWIIWFGSEPKLRHLHGDPRFTKLLRLTAPEFAERLARAASR